MANEYGNITTGDASRREDLADIITNISPKETPFVSGLPVKEAKDTLHQWEIDVLAAPASNAQIEGHVDAQTLLVNPTRVINVTQILRKDGMISGTQEAVVHAGFNSAMAYQVMKKTAEWKNDLEYAAILGTLGTGASGTARTMKGALAMITSVTTALSSASLSETIYNSLLELAWSNFESNIDEVYVGGFLKRKISGFTAGATKNINSSDKRLVSNVDVYQGDYEIQKIFKTRTLNSTGASTATMMMIDSSKWALAYLRKPQYVKIPNDGGDRERFKIIGEVTIECQADGSNASATGLANDA